MKWSPHKISFLELSLGLCSVVVAYFLGLPAHLLLWWVGAMAAHFLLHVLWVKDSFARAMGGSLALTFVLLWLGGHFFHLPWFAVVFGAVLMTVVFACNFFWAQRSMAKARATLAQWAVANGGQLLEFEHRLSPGPFGGWRGRTDLYFQFVVADRRHQRHQGWAHFDAGLLSNGQYQIKWIENV